MQDNKKRSVYQHLKEKWTQKHQEVAQKVLANHKDVLPLLSNYVIGGVMLASAPFLSVAPNMLQPESTSAQQTITHITPLQLVNELRDKLPADVGPLTLSEETAIIDTLAKRYNVKLAAELSGIRLERNYGLIGKEQHLRRYPGDDVYQHFDTDNEAQLFAADGAAPGLGAWGYFAPSKEQFGQREKLREKYYIAIQTFLAPGFNQHVGEYGLFFKYRKMLVVNPENGKGIITDIADAGPATWTEKHLGGSPEVMHYLERVDGAQKGPVLYFFVDDPNDTIPLGPITL